MSRSGVCNSGRILPIALERGMNESLKSMPQRQIFKELNLIVFKRDGAASFHFIRISVGRMSLLLKLKLIKLN